MNKTQSAGIERWQMSRAGVTNFWYFDEEIFDLVDGRLLFRGANGSGKSVTMQSLVPLLFDGDKSPVRLDPFGSTARRMESYLLSDGLNLEERTGYLFLEFIKPKSKTTITIGMGMRARKNMALDSWYFIVLDGKRIGPSPEFDISLVKDLGDRVPLTKKELENKLGDGGRVFSSQREYKAAVNDHVFGFEDLDAYDELITLLIQLRSPKLSKEFRPSTMYEILQTALQTLSDDDLRPMSEAIESMDELKNKMDHLQGAIHALNGIRTYFDRYNALELVNKAHLYVRSMEQVVTYQKIDKEQRMALDTFEVDMVKTKTAIVDLEREQSVRQEAVERLKVHDVSKLVEQKTKLKTQLTLKEAEKIKKSEAIERDDLRYTGFERDLRNIQGKGSDIQKQLMGKSEDLTEGAEICGFDEHQFYLVEKDHKGHEGQIKEHARLLRAAKEALQKQDEATLALDREQEALSRAEHEAQTKTRRHRDSEQLLLEEKDRYVETLYSWGHGLEVLQIPRAVLGQSAERAQQYGAASYFSAVLGPTQAVADVQLGQLQIQRATLGGQLENLSKQCDQQRLKLEALRAQKDPEPPREPGVIANRQRLTLAGIPHMPLYMAIDFTKDLTDEHRAIFEEALSDMGLLDALIVPKAFRQQALATEVGQKDRYIFESPAYLNVTLAQALVAESGQLAVDRGQVGDVLMSILLDAQSGAALFTDSGDQGNSPLISESGHYQMGLIVGSTARNQQSAYIGQASRKRLMGQRIEEAALELSVLREALQALEAQQVAIALQLQKAQGELSNFPVVRDIELALKMVAEATLELSAANKDLANRRELVEAAYQALKAHQQQVAQATQKLNLPLTLERFDQAVSAFEQYIEDYYQYSRDCLALDSLAEQQKQCEASLLDLAGRLEEARDSLGLLEREHMRLRANVLQIDDQLALSDNQAAIAELEAQTLWLQAYPSKWQALNHELSELTAQSSALSANHREHAQKHPELIATEKLYAQFFRWEYALGYVEKVQEEDFDDDGALQGVAKNVLKVHQSLLSDRKALTDLRDEVQTRIMREGGLLADYHIKRIERFKPTAISGAVSDFAMGTALDAALDETAVERLNELQFPLARIDYECRASGRVLDFYELIHHIGLQISENQDLLNERDRELFEEILLNSISAKISAKIRHSEQWVAKMDELMGSMNTSMGLKLNLKWHMKSAEKEGQLSTQDLVTLLRRDSGLLTQGQRDSLIDHFRSKITQVKQLSSGTEQQGFLALMKEVLDYRNWFEFQLFFTKGSEPKKVLTNNAFFTFSGGEKAMAMYVPLFSAVNAKYMSARRDTPRVISLDEAFAGVDEKNIKDMFRLLIELDLDFMANSQVLYGDYDTVPGLAISELIRPESITYVTVIRYLWNGEVRSLVVDPHEEGQ